MSGQLERPTAEARAAMVADYDAGMTCAQVADKHGVAKSSVNRYVRKAHGMPPTRVRAEQAEQDIALTDGQWIRDGLVMRWEQWVA